MKTVEEHLKGFGLDDGEISSYLPLGGSFVKVGWLTEDQRPFALALYVMHLKTLMEDPSKSLGRATSVREGDLSVSYSVDGSKASWFDLTHYGRILKALFDQSGLSLDAHVPSIVISPYRGTSL